MTTVHIDWTRCTGRGTCIELLAGVLRPDDWGYPVAETGGSDVPIPTSRAADARDAVALCPRLALSLREHAR